MSSNTSYSRAEWTSLSIQDRIRAMNQTLAKEEERDEPAPPKEASVGTSPSTDDSSPGQATPAVSEGPKRASVVDIWRKREGTTTNSEANRGSPAPNSKSAPGKKPPTPGPGTTTGSPTATQFPPLSSEDPISHHDLPKKAGVAELIKQRNQGNSIKPGLKQTSPKSLAPPVIDRPVDLTILPAEENETESSSVPAKRGRVSDIWKHATSTPPQSNGQHKTDATTETPRRSKVADIWTRRASDQSKNGSNEESTSPPGSARQDVTEEAPKRSRVVDIWTQRSPEQQDSAYSENDVVPWPSDIQPNAEDDAPEIEAIDGGTDAFPSTAQPRAKTGKVAAGASKAATKTSVQLTGTSSYASSPKRSIADRWTKRDLAKSDKDEIPSRPAGSDPGTPSTPTRVVSNRWTNRSSAPNTPGSRVGTATQEKKQLTPRSFAKIAPETVGNKQFVGRDASSSWSDPTLPPTPTSQPAWMNQALRPTPKTLGSFEEKGSPRMTTLPVSLPMPPTAPTIPDEDAPRSQKSQINGHAWTVSSGSDVPQGPASTPPSAMPASSFGSESTAVSGALPRSYQSAGLRAQALQIALKQKKPKNALKYAFPEPPGDAPQKPASLQSSSSAFMSEDGSQSSAVKQKLPPTIPSKSATQWTLKDVMKKNRLKPANAGSPAYAMSLSGSGSHDSPSVNHSMELASVDERSIVRKSGKKISPSTPGQVSQIGASSLSSLVQKDEPSWTSFPSGTTSIPATPAHISTPDRPIRRLAPSSRDTVTRSKLMEDDDGPGHILPRKSPGDAISEERKKFLQERRDRQHTIPTRGLMRSTSDQRRSHEDEKIRNFVDRRDLAKKKPSRFSRTETSTKRESKIRPEPTTESIHHDTVSPFAGNRYHHKKQREARTAARLYSTEENELSESVISAGSSNFSAVFSTFSPTSSVADSAASPQSALANRASLVLKNRRRRLEQQQTQQSGEPSASSTIRPQTKAFSGAQKSSGMQIDRSQHPTKKAERGDRHKPETRSRQARKRQESPRPDPIQARESRISRMGADRRHEPRLVHRYSEAGRFLENPSEDTTNQQTASFGSESDVSSHVPSPEVSVSDASENRVSGKVARARPSINRSRIRAPTKDTSRDESVSQGFVDESSNNLKSFRAAYETMSFQQLAHDLKEEVSTVAKHFSFQKQGTAINRNTKATSESMHKKTTSESVKQLKIPSAIEQPSVDEGIAIEVEYVTTDGEETIGSEDTDAICQEFDNIRSRGGQDYPFAAPSRREGR